jgi:hypothetical protein
MTREALADRLRTLPEPPRFRLPAATVAPGIVALRGDGGAASVWAGHTGAVDMRRPSLWSSRIGEDTRILLADGLPSAERAVALFDADSGLWAGTASTGGL